VIHPHAVGDDLDRVPVPLYDSDTLPRTAPSNTLNQKIVPPGQPT
jgi:hypothetical protein